MLETYPDILKLKDLCQILGIGKNTAYKLLQNKEIPNTKIAGKYIIPKLGIVKMLENIT